MRINEDLPNFDTPDNPLTGTDQGAWPGGDSGERSTAEADREMQETSQRRAECLRERRIESLEDL